MGEALRGERIICITMNKANNVVYHIADHPLTMGEWEAKCCSPDENVSN
jgi:hypothetical protein